MFKYQNQNPNFKNKKQIIYSFCEMPFRHIKINVTGDVTMCCYQGKFLGNIFKDNIIQIWNNSISKEIREKTLNGELHNNCQEWGGCPYINKNLKENNQKVVFLENYPISLEIDLPPTHCNIGGENPNDKNQACVMCPRNFDVFRKSENFKLNNTKKIIDSIKCIVPNLILFSVLGVAEPFYKDLIFEIFEEIEFKKYQNNINFWTYSNGSIFNEILQKKYLEIVKKSFIYFSIDAATKETYKSIRRRDFFEIIQKNLNLYNKIKGENHRSIMYNNINTLNVKEMEDMVVFAKDNNFNEIQFNPTHDCGSLTSEKTIQDIMVTKDNVSVFLENSEKAKEKAKEINMPIKMVREFEQVVGNDLIQLTI